jgi:transmembrane sensor
MNVARDRTASVIAEEAADWVVRLADTDARQHDQREFVAWIKRSPLHLRSYLDAERTWTDLGKIDAQRRLDVEALLAAPDSNIVQLADSVRPAVARPSRRSVITSLAASVLFACVGLVWFQAQFSNRFTTGVGEQRTLRLSDGSTVVLNTDTSVRVSFSDTVREVHLLDGEALFDVASNPARPFRVRSDHVVAQAVGTSFVVRKNASQTVVTVIEGKVAVVDLAQFDVAAPEIVPPQAVHVSAGTRADVIAADVRTAPVANPAAVTSWRSGRLIFDGTPLSEVVAEFNRYNDVQLELEGDHLSDERISGVFDSNQPQALARFLERSGVIEPVAAAGNRIALVPQQPSR